ncbi:MAG: biopolymer transporter ExbD [Treponema sp.]|jgi:biopolymer transport protein ExbD|nr:biopolymer transporter ExbD [Treponema sp.]
MKDFIGRKPSRAAVNITSLIDVIFMLVVFFMLGASFEKPAIVLTLPRASSTEIPEKLLLTVSVDAGGTLRLEGVEEDRPSLYARLAAYGRRTGELNVALECDGSVDFAIVAAVMDTIKKAGARNVAIRHNPL